MPEFFTQRMNALTPESFEKRLTVINIQIQFQHDLSKILHNYLLKVNEKILLGDFFLRSVG